MTTTNSAGPEPHQVAPGTWVLPQVEQAPPVGLFGLNSLVIQGAEPVLVDTGTRLNRTRWLEQAFELVDPADVRWVFISHDDSDHVGNLDAVLDRCPRATVLLNWFGVGRLAPTQPLPMHRVRFMNDGDTLALPDRTLVAVTPPLFDAPTTRGVYDTSTGVYWAADCFAAPMQEYLPEASDAPRDEWREGFLLANRMNSPWHAMLDPRRFGATIDRLEELVRRTPMGLQAVASAHGPVVRAPLVAEALRLLREVPHLPAWAPPTQFDLETWAAQTATGVPAQTAPASGQAGTMQATITSTAGAAR